MRSMGGGPHGIRFGRSYMKLFCVWGFVLAYGNCVSCQWCVYVKIC